MSDVKTVACELLVIQARYAIFLLPVFYCEHQQPFFPPWVTGVATDKQLSF